MAKLGTRLRPQCSMTATALWGGEIEWGSLERKAIGRDLEQARSGGWGIQQARVGMLGGLEGLVMGVGEVRGQP